MFTCIWFLLTVNLWKIYKTVEKLGSYDSVSTPISYSCIFFTLDLVVDHTDMAVAATHIFYVAKDTMQLRFLCGTLSLVDRM